MKQFFKDLISENNPMSTSRFALLFTLFMNLGLAIVICVLCFQTANIIYISALIDLIALTFGIGFTGKVVNKFAENKENKTEEIK